MLAQPIVTPTLNVTRRFKATRQAVFDAWTQAQALQRWFAPDASVRTEVIELDVRVGGRYRISMHEANGEINTVSGRFLSIESPEYLSFTWAWEPQAGETALDYSQSKVTLRFIQQADETELQLQHQGLPNDALYQEHEKGWIDCIERLPLAL